MAVAFPSRRRICGARIRRRGLHRCSKLAKDAAEKCGLGDPRELALPRTQAGAPQLPASVPRSQVLGVLADYVTMDTGTGVVHTAPSHGADDFITGVKYGLDATSNVDDAGICATACPNTTASGLAANQPIIDLAEAAARCCTRRRSSTPILIAGAATIPSSSAPPSSGSSPWKRRCPAEQGKDDTLRTRTLAKSRT
jgi:hypothetical protein